MSAEASPIQRFVVEAREHLAGMTSAIMALERGADDPTQHVAELLRLTHSLKGGAGFSGLGRIAELAHALEAAVESIRDGRVAPTGQVVDVLLFVLDRISTLVDDSVHSETADISEPLERLRAIGSAGWPTDGITGLATSSHSRPSQAEVALVRLTAGPGEFPISHRVLDAWHRHAAFLYGVKFDWFQCERALGLTPLEVAQRVEQAGTVLDSRMEPSRPALAAGPVAPPLWYWAIVSSALGPEQFARQLDIPCAAVVRLESVGNGPRTARAEAAAPAPRPVAASTSLRVPVTLIDRMMGLAGELVLIRNQATHSTDPSSVLQRQLMRRLDTITNDLQDAALRMRMQPVGTLFDRFPRLVRDLARQLGKQIDLEITGTEVELDKTIIELLADPLTHLVRNCCDHGIESPEQRHQAGKSPTGLIRLSACQERGQILIQIRDDGRGLDREAIKRKALQQKVKRSDELDQLSERQLYDLILLSGFSTAAQVTDLSGRGVGMDVVRTNLEQIGGLVEIDSVIGGGATFTLRLPLTLAIMPCLLLRSGTQQFAVPQRDVERIVRLDPADRRLRIECTNEEEVLRLHERLLPVARLSEVLGGREPFTSATRREVIARYHDTAATDAPFYVAVLKFGARQFGLVVDDILESEEIVVKPLHPLLRPLGVYAGATILGNGEVALILSVEGVARQSGIAYRPLLQEPVELPAPAQAGELQTLLLFRSGPAELLAMPLADVKRVVRLGPDQIESVGDREFVSVDDAAINVLRLERFLGFSPVRASNTLFLILPRATDVPVGVLATEIVDTPTLSLELDDRAYRAEGILGTALIRGQIAVLLDMPRLGEMWEMGVTAARPALPGPAGKRILVVEDSHFFRQLIARCLESAGHTVAVAADGTEGIRQLATESFDLVVSDIEMPGLDGLALARQIRQEARFEPLPLLALTSLSSAEDRGRMLAAGFDAHEVKFDRRRFLATVQALLTRGRPPVGLLGGPDHV